MKYEVILQEAERSLVEIHDKDCFGEVFNIINTEETNSPELYAEACRSLGFEVGKSGHLTIKEEEIEKLAAITLVFSSLTEIEYSFPIFFNQQRENIKVQHLTNELYLFQGFDVVIPLEPELENQFLETMNSSNGNFIISASSILEILACYKDMEDISIAIADYIINIRDDKELLCDFTVKDVEFVRYAGSSAHEVLRTIHKQNRLDVCSLNILQKAIEG